MLSTFARRALRALPAAHKAWQRPSFPPSSRPRETSRGRTTRCFVSKAKAKRKEHCCSNCGFTSVQYFGSCPNCGEFGTCKEVSFAGPASAGKGSNGASNDVGQAVSREFSAQQGWLQGTARVSSLSKVRSGLSSTTHVLQLNGDLGTEMGRVLGGGIRAGSLVLVGGGPGLGKSTLLIQLAALIGSAPPWAAPESSPLARTTERVLYVSGEESEDQLAERAERLQIDDGGNVDLLCDNDMDVILEQIHAHKPKAVILDSIQTVSLGGVTGSNGSVSQVRECAKALVIVCKQTLGIPVFLVGHITKGGDLAGPKTLEHIVDATLYLEGEESSACRVLRVNKNRFGSTDEVGLFEMTRGGLAPLLDPAAFLQQRQAAGRSAAACATAVLLEGNRPVMVEVQALCNEVFKDNPPRRMVNGGLDWKRFDQVLAVLIKHGRMKLYNQDARVNVLGGAPAMEPAADAAMAAAIISSFYDVQMPSDIAFVGEVDLGGDLRPVRGTEKRVAAAVNLGFERVLAPAGTKAKVPKALSKHVVDCANIRMLKRTLVGKSSAQAAEAA